MPWNRKVNLKNEDCQTEFKKSTTQNIDKGYLSSVFDENYDINIATEKFMKRLEKTIAKFFRKIRVKEKIDEEKEELFRNWKEMKKNDSNVDKSKFEEIERKLSEKYAEEFYNKIKDKTTEIDCQEGGLNSGNLWKQIFPKSKDPPTAMVDPQTGNLLTSEEKIEGAALDVYKERLRTGPSIIT